MTGGKFGPVCWLALLAILGMGVAQQAQDKSQAVLTTVSLGEVLDLGQQTAQGTMVLLEPGITYTIRAGLFPSRATALPNSTLFQGKAPEPGQPPNSTLDFRSFSKQAVALVVPPGALWTACECVPQPV